MSLASVFLIIVSSSTHGLSTINAVPMADIETCIKVKNYINTDVVHVKDKSLFADKDLRRDIYPPLFIECKEIK